MCILSRKEEDIERLFLYFTIGKRSGHLTIDNFKDYHVCVEHNLNCCLVIRANMPFT